MSGRASKNKGKGGERELCKILSTYIGGNFERVAYSGAFIGGKNFTRKEKMTEGQIRAAKSDIVPPDHLPKLVVESKFYKEFPYHSFAMNKDIPILDKWISELEHDCDEGDLGILCVKINRKGWFVAYSKDQNFEVENHCVYKGYIVTSLEDFLEKNKNEVISLSSPALQHHSDIE